MPSPRAKPGLQAPRTSILTRAVRQYALFAVCIVLTLSVISFVIARGFLEQRVLAQLSSIVAAKEDLVEQGLQNDRGRVSLLATRSEMRGIIQGKVGSIQLEKLLTHVREEHIPIMGMALFNISGKEVAKTNLAPRTLPPIAEKTVIQSVINEYGWQEHEIFSPVRAEDDTHIGMLGVRYDSTPLRDILLSISAIGKTGEVLLGAEEAGELVLLHHRFQPSGGKTLILGNLEEQYAYGLSLARAVKGEEALRRAEDYAGKDVYSAYRTLQSLGWGIVVNMARREALEGTMRLALFLSLAGIVLVIGAGIMAYFLAHHLTDPLIHLSTRLGRLGPGHWSLKRSVHTGDEVEMLDHVVVDMAARLKKAYGHLEEMVEERTKELSEQYAKDRAILQNIQYGVITVGPTGVITGANPSAISLLKTRQEDLIGTRVGESIPLCLSRKILGKTQHPVLSVLKKRKSYRADPNKHMNIVCSNDVLLPVSFIVTPISEGKRLLGAVMVFQDMTEERRVDYIKSEFISLASHQLRTPLSTIKWFLEILADKKNNNLSPMQMESIKEMEHASSRMSNLIDTLLHAARLEGGTITPKMQKVNLTMFLRDMGEEFCALSKDSGIACQAIVPDESVMIATDPILLHVVLQNLFSNAVKYSEKGNNVSMSLKKGNRFVEIEVKDSGMGIPQNEQERVFERLFRARNVREVDTGGSGLGLYISKMVVEIIGGTISFESSEGKGTTFTVRLPLTNTRK